MQLQIQLPLLLAEVSKFLSISFDGQKRGNIMIFYMAVTNSNPSHINKHQVVKEK
jgi:hypothetical protein